MRKTRYEQPATKQSIVIENETNAILQLGAPGYVLIEVFNESPSFRLSS